MIFVNKNPPSSEKLSASHANPPPQPEPSLPPSGSLAPHTPPTLAQTAYALIPASPPHPRPSLKRSRSSPTFSPTSTPNTNPNPFLPLCSDPIKALPFSAMSKTPPPQISLPLSNPPGPILRTNKFLLLDPCFQNEDPHSHL